MPRSSLMPPVFKSMRRLHFYLGYGSMTLAVLGLILPLLPTTPFLLLSVWCFARSDPEWAERLYRHPRLGALLSSWRDERAVPFSAKMTAVVALGVSYAVFLWSMDNRFLHLLLAVVMSGVALYLLTRPLPGRARRSTPKQFRGWPNDLNFGPSDEGTR